MAPDPADEVELTMVTMAFDAVDPDRLQAVLARYVVLSRGHPGCRNIDLAMSSTHPNRFVIVQKWESPEHQQAHFDSADMVSMAESCVGLLAAAPAIDLLDPISAHDLR
jgi:quinol monooxygenase YgiN